jgi:IPT/TIG domain
VAFSSHTDGGKLKYSTPPIMQIHNTVYESFNSLEEVTYDLSIIDYDMMTDQFKTLKCMDPALPQYCLITYSRAYTPILHYISPSVLYSGLNIVFYLDPRNAQEKKSPTLPELPWTEVHLNGYGVDYEGFIDETTILPSWQKVQVRGVMGAIEPSNDVNVEYRFRVGYAMHMEHSMTRCSYDNSTCYKAKAVARIDSIDATEGYTTGGQTLTVNGHGFNGDEFEVLIDGIPCRVFENDVHHFKCITGAQTSPSS